MMIEGNWFHVVFFCCYPSTEESVAFIFHIQYSCILRLQFYYQQLSRRACHNANLSHSHYPLKYFCRILLEVIWACSHASRFCNIRPGKEISNNVLNLRSKPCYSILDLVLVHIFLPALHIHVPWLWQWDIFIFSLGEGLTVWVVMKLVHIQMFYVTCTSCFSHWFERVFIGWISFERCGLCTHWYNQDQGIQARSTE